LSVKAPLKTIEEIIYSKRRWIARVRQRLKTPSNSTFPKGCLGRQVPIVFWQGKTIELNEQLLFPSERKAREKVNILKNGIKGKLSSS
jgi:hypothetical protein